jgi:magnesium chelatase family protein
MSFSRIYGAQTNLLKGKVVTIETDITKNTLYAFTIVGLPDKAVDESKDRVSSALKNSNLPSPKNQNQKIVISLSPADLKKEGPYFDLAIALSYLLSAGEINFDPEEKIFLGELSLNGDLQPIKGTLPLVQEAKKLGFKEVFLPFDNKKEAALVEGINIYGAKNLTEIIDHINIPLKNKKDILPEKPKIKIEEKTEIVYEEKISIIDFADIKGQEAAKRGLEIAASGGHNIAMYGPPGTGKTMLARAFSCILPNLNKEEVLEITGIHSVVGTCEDTLVIYPPFRSPHHTASYVSMIGGGVNPKPGEVTLAHKGVLFLDEFPEFEKRVLESLRQPLEDNIVSISRAKGSAIFPSNFILIAAMNPCPCGNKGSKQKQCICRPSDLDRYKRKLSGPIMDRIDIWVNVGNVDYEKLSDNTKDGDSTKVIKERVLNARKIQEKRFKNSERKIKSNSDINVKELNIYAPLSEEVRKILNQSAEKLQLSARAYHRTIKLARTIADLEGSENIKISHILEALQYRPKEL